MTYNYHALLCEVARKVGETPTSERWKPVKDYWGRYWISNHGRLWSTFAGGRVRKAVTNKRGYRHANLCKDGKTTWHRIHKLVAECFIGPCPEGLQVNHKDGNRLNNCLNNLEYVTGLENMRHAVTAGLMANRAITGEGNGRSKLTDKEILFIRKKYTRYSRKWGTKGLSQMFGVHQMTVWRIITGEAWGHLNKGIDVEEFEEANP